MIRRRLDSAPASPTTHSTGGGGGGKRSDAVSVPGTAPSSSSADHPSVVRFRQDVPATNSPSDQSQEQSQEQHRPRSRSSTRSYSSGGTCDRDRDSVISEMADSDVVDVRAVAAGTSEEDTSTNNSNNGEQSRWSATLRSPTAGGAFSPSLELNAKSSTSIHTSSSSSGTSASLHGLGLRAASDRARTLSKCGKRCATLLADVAVLHDAWAKSMLQSCHNLAALDGIFAPPVSPLLHKTNRRLTSFAKQTQGLAICLRGSVARPLHGSSSAMAEAVPGIFNRYALARAECASKRHSALRARARYGKAVGEADAAIGTLRRAKNQEENGNDITDATATGAASASAENGSDILSWEDLKRKLFVGGKKQGGLSQPSQLVMKALEEVQRCEGEYRRLVEEENRAVSRAQTMEVTALDSLQKLEEERLQFLVETLGRALQAERGALDKMDLLTVPEPHAQLGGEGVDDAASAMSDANDASVGSQLQLSSSSILNKVLPAAAAADAGAGKSAVQGAIELNLPEDVGRWRDTMKQRLLDQTNCTHALKAVAAYFMEIASAAFEFSTGLRSKLAEVGYVGVSSKNKSGDALAIVLNQSEGDRALACWSRYIETLGNLAKATSDLGSQIKEDGDKLIAKPVVTAEKDLRSAIDSEEMRWKHCTDHAKAEAKARLRHEQSVAALDKAEDRMAAHAASFASTSASVSQQYGVGAGMSSPMTKAIGGMLSMLPSGMEDEALTKMLNSEQRLALAKKTLEEATAKQQADKLAYESAQIAKDKAIQSYVATARAADNQATVKVETLWNAVTVGFEVIVSSFQHFRKSRYAGIDPASIKMQECSGPRVLEDLFEWSFSMQQNLVSHIEETTSRNSGSSNDTDGFALKVMLVRSKDVYKLLHFVAEGENGEAKRIQKNARPHNNDNDEMSNGAPRTPVSTKVQESSRVRPKLKPLSEHKVNSDELFDGEQDAIMTEGMHRSSSMPVVAIERMSVASKELKNLAETLKVATAEKAAKAAPESSSDAEMQLFLAHFGEEEESGEAASGGGKQTMPPTVIDSYSCAYWPEEKEGSMSPLLHGRLFVTSQKMYFIGWGDKKLILKWEDVVSITKDSIGVVSIPYFSLIFGLAPCFSCLVISRNLTISFFNARNCLCTAA